MSIKFTEIKNFDNELASIYRAAEAKKTARKVQASIKMVNEGTVILEDANGLYAV
jgi:hypothetical protein